MYSFTDNINDFKAAFIKEYGERKYRIIHSKISQSKKIHKLIRLSQSKQMAPNKNDFMYRLNEIPYFLFTRPDNLALGSVLALELWHNTLNTNYYFLSEYNLNNVFNGIIFDCERMKKK